MALDEPAPLLYRALHRSAVPLVKALWRPTVEGLAHIPSRGPAILASNHLSFLDSVFLPAVLRRPVYFLGKSDYFHGWRRHFFENVGVMPVDRSGGDASEASLRKGAEILAAGRLLGIYPEGTRSPDGRLYRGKTGPVRLAARTGAPLIPVAMIGTFEVLPPGALLPRLGRVSMRVGAPIAVDQRESDRQALRTSTDKLMYELMLLSGQEYVDEYAAPVKAGEVSIGSGDLEQLGQTIDERREADPGAEAG